MGVWAVGTLNQLFIRGSETEKVPEHEHIFSKYSRNLNISGIF